MESIKRHDMNAEFKMKDPTAPGEGSADLSPVPRPRQIHYLKSWPKFFERVLAGTKNYEVRRDDRGFEVGDGIVLHEWCPDKLILGVRGYTGRVVTGKILWIARSGDVADVAPGAIGEGYEVLGVEWELS
jgi:hypothetical protein